MNFSKRKELLHSAIVASLKAGSEILDVYQSDDFEIQLKLDDSPLTIADQRAHAAIVSIIDNLGIPVLSEEGIHSNYEERKSWKQCWIVDPLDGTKEFIKRNDEFTVNIALIDGGKPVAGVIYVPVFRQLYFADIELGAFRMDNIENWERSIEDLIQASRQMPFEQNREEIRVLGSRSHMNKETQLYIEELKKEYPKLHIISKGSSLKLCLIAENEADIYPRFSPTMEWDIAAGHAIVSASGAKVLHIDSETELTYNKEDLLNPFFMCKR